MQVRSLVESWSSVFRSLVLLTCASAIMCAFVVGSLVVLSRLTELDGISVPGFSANFGIRLTDQGSVVLDGKNEKSAIVMLPASAGWLDTGVDVPAGWLLDIKATGQAQLAAAHLIEDTQNHSIVRFGWAGPDGTTFDESSATRYVPRRPFLLFQRSDETPRIGQLVGFLASTNEGIAPPSLTSNPRPAPIFEINTARQCRNGGSGSRRLYIAVNDLVLDGTTQAKAAFVGFTDDQLAAQQSPADPDTQQRLTTWDAIRGQHYWRYFYDDNIGSFLITIRLIPSSTGVAPCGA